MKLPRGRLGVTVPLLASMTTAAVVSSVGAEAITTPAGAAACAPNYKDYQIGYIKNPPGNDPNNVEGISSNLTVRQAALCTGQSGGYDPTTNELWGNVTSEWVMIEGGNFGAGGTKYDQVGHVKWAGSSQYAFSQNSDPALNVYNYSYVDTTNALALGSTHNFKVAWSNTNCAGGLLGCFKNYVDGSLFSQSVFDPTTDSGWLYPWMPSAVGETIYPQTAVAGSASAPEEFTDMAAQNYNTNAWSTTFPGGGQKVDTQGTTYQETNWNTCSGSLCFNSWTP